ncbi:MAG: hypothetical protein ABSE56_02835 [Bryobacteraceae bacterium]|jgi:hypothetical protein
MRADEQGVSSAEMRARIERTRLDQILPVGYRKTALVRVPSLALFAKHLAEAVQDRSLYRSYWTGREC